MQLNNVSIKNFRCFADYDLSFGKAVTILIGKNGSGKTNLMHALKKGLSFMFASKTNSKTPEARRSLVVSNNCSVRSFNLSDTYFDASDREFVFPTKITCVATFNNRDLQWELLKEKDPGGLHSTQYKEALDTVLNHYNTDRLNTRLPILAFFSDSYPHVGTNLGSKAKGIVNMDVLPRDFAYYGWDDDTSCSELWQLRYIKVSSELTSHAEGVRIKVDQLLNERAFLENGERDEDTEKQLNEVMAQLDQIQNKPLQMAYKKERDFIDKRIHRFTEPIQKGMELINAEFEIEYIAVMNCPDETKLAMWFYFNDGNNITFEQMPQGYKRLLSIAIDIAYRSFILNGDQEPTGIVIIDEVELHLHPTLQQEVITRLSKTFPEVQFIVSTHSPLVISNTQTENDRNKIVKLERDGSQFRPVVIDNLYGLDYTTSLMEVMETNYRASDIDDLIDSYVIFYLNDKKEDAQKAWDDLFAIVGANNVHIKKEIDLRIKANS